MQKEFVSYNTALALKELGFNEPCFGKYDIYGSFDHKLFYHNHDSETSLNCSAPTFSQALKWFREKGYDVKVQKESEGLYFGFYWTGAAWIIVGNGTYEEAEQACLNKLIEIVKDDNTSN